METNFDESFHQFSLDYYLNECIMEFQQKLWELSSETINLLNVLLHKKMDPVYPGNTLKAHIISILSHVQKLQSMGLEDTFVLQATDNKEALESLKMLQSSLYVIHQLGEPEAASDVSRQGLFYVSMLIVQFVSLQISSETNSTKDLQEVEESLGYMKQAMDDKSHKEITLYDKCARALAQNGQQLDVIAPSQVWSLIATLILKLAPSISLQEESFYQLHKVLSERMEIRRSKFSDLFAIMSHHKEDIQNEEAVRDLLLRCEILKKDHKQGKTLKQRKRYSYFTEKITSAPLTSPNRRKTDSATYFDTSRLSYVEKGSKKYPRLRGIRPRWSLLAWNKSMKAPSHNSVFRGKWLPEEVEDFIVQTLTIGEGKWGEIKKATHSLRSNVQLKDKWRQISDREKRAVAKDHGLVYEKS